MTNTDRLKKLTADTLDIQRDGLDRLVGLSSVVIEVFFHTGKPPQVNIRPQTKTEAS